MVSNSIMNNDGYRFSSQRAKNVHRYEKYAGPADGTDEVKKPSRIQQLFDISVVKTPRKN